MDDVEYIVFGCAIPICCRRLAKSGLMGSERAFGSWLTASDGNAGQSRRLCQQVIVLDHDGQDSKKCIFGAYLHPL